MRVMPIVPSTKASSISTLAATFRSARRSSRLTPIASPLAAAPSPRRPTTLTARPSIAWQVGARDQHAVTQRRGLVAGAPASPGARPGVRRRAAPARLQAAVPDTVDAVTAAQRRGRHGEHGSSRGRSSTALRKAPTGELCCVVRSSIVHARVGSPPIRSRRAARRLVPNSARAGSPRPMAARSPA